MIRYYFYLFLLFSFSIYCHSQVDKSRPDSGFEEKDNSTYQKNYTEREIKEYVTKVGKSTRSTVIGGLIASIFHEPVDSVAIGFFVEKEFKDSLFCFQGLFRFPVSQNDSGKLIGLHFNHPDYFPYDTSFIYNTIEPVILSINLRPRLKIALRGRIFAGNMPLEGVKVEIKNKDKIYQMVTRGCFYDKEDYWNCLYDGMFKQDLQFEKPSDSIVISFNKEGMKPLTLGMQVKEFGGEIMELKMKYTSKLPFIPKNDLSLKLGFPFTTSKNDWFIDLAYFRSLKINNFNRLSVGLDANMILTNVSNTVSVSDSIFPGKGVAVSDSSYISEFIGPSCLLWLTPPENRYFSTYMGLTAAFNINNHEFSFQPFIGTRVFLDLNKAISIELRHVSYNLDVVHYTFNPYGNAYRNMQLTDFNEYIFDIGIQVVF
jgi:hypothetical protein